MRMPIVPVATPGSSSPLRRTIPKGSCPKALGLSPMCRTVAPVGRWTLRKTGWLVAHPSPLTFFPPPQLTRPPFGVGLPPSLVRVPAASGPPAFFGVTAVIGEGKGAGPERDETPAGPPGAGRTGAGGALVVGHADGREEWVPQYGTTGAGKPPCSAFVIGTRRSARMGESRAALLDPFEQGAGVAFDLVVAARNRDG
jgi:hypothetical protein